MSPEQCAGHPTDARSDIYSLAVILYEMLTGRPPFDAPTATAIAIKHIQEQPPALKGFRPDVPDSLERLVMQALDKNPANRPQTAAEFLHKLNDVAITSAKNEDPQAGRVPASGRSEPQTFGQTSIADTNPRIIERADTSRAGGPTQEMSSAADDDHSVQAYIRPPERATEQPARAATRTPARSTCAQVSPSCLSVATVAVRS